MIGRVRREYNPGFSAYGSDGAGMACECPLRSRITSGFVELIGETQPKPYNPAATPSRSKPKGGGRKPQEPTLYEYHWSVGITGDNDQWFQELAGDRPLIVQIIFHTSGAPFGIREMAANLKQVPPFKKTRAQEIQDFFDMLRPLAETAGKAMEAGGLGAPGKMISAISGMKLNAVPIDKFPWYIKTFSLWQDSGIEWHIPKALIDLTGNRIVGSVGLYFFECGEEGKDLNAPLSLEIKAFVRAGDGRLLSDQWKELFISPTNESAKLIIQPMREAVGGRK